MRPVSHSFMSDSATPRTIVCQAPLSLGFPLQEYWSGKPFLSPGDLSNPGIYPMSPALQADSLPLSHQGSPLYLAVRSNYPCIQKNTEHSLICI